jgi:hypothetical protein
MVPVVETDQRYDSPVPRPSRALRKLAGLPWWWRDLRRFRRVARAHPDWSRIEWKPKTLDRLDDAGVMRGAYFHQDLLVARRIFEAEPRRHLDVGSRVDGFVAHVASFRRIEIVDIRPLRSTVPEISFLRADVMKPDSAGEAICDSLSCLHVLEHFGLGRYGDPIDVMGYEKGFATLDRMLAPGGTLYLSVPIGRQAVLFNAHRRFHTTTILEMAEGSLDLRRFDFVDDAGDLHRDVDLDRPRRDPTLGCRREGCGIFEFRKRSQ